MYAKLKLPTSGRFAGLFIASIMILHELPISGQQTDEQDQRPAWSIEYDTVERRAIERQMAKDLNRLSIGDLSRFHRDLVETLGPVLPHHIDVKYIGPLAIEGVHPSLKIHGQGFTRALYWSVEGSVGICTFWISTARTESTVAVSKAGKKTIYLNLIHVDRNQPATKPLKDLGGKSVKEILKLMEPPQELSATTSESCDNPPAIAEKHRKGKMADFQELIDLIQKEIPNFEPPNGYDITK